MNEIESSPEAQNISILQAETQPNPEDASGDLQELLDSLRVQMQRTVQEGLLSYFRSRQESDR